MAALFGSAGYGLFYRKVLLLIETAEWIGAEGI
jgi:hypothetical protein